MKALLSLVLLAVLSGCAIVPAGPAAGVYVAPAAVVVQPTFYYRYHRGYWR